MGTFVYAARSLSFGISSAVIDNKANLDKAAWFFSTHAFIPRIATGAASSTLYPNMTVLIDGKAIEEISGSVAARRLQAFSAGFYQIRGVLRYV